MKNLKELDKYRVPHPWWPQTDTAGAFKVFVGGRSFHVLVRIDPTDDGMWEHISVTPNNQKRCPTWEEMCAIKDMFFLPEEDCIQVHPKRSEYVNHNEYCLHIWRPVDGNRLFKPRPFPTLAERDEKLEDLWYSLSDVPMDPDTEKLEEDWFIFTRGTDREEIWRWFDERYSKGVACLLYGCWLDRKREIANLLYQKQLCFECESRDCVYNGDGICHFPMVRGEKPNITEEHGCRDYFCREDW